jgi:molecular chaperone GrpE
VTHEHPESEVPVEEGASMPDAPDSTEATDAQAVEEDLAPLQAKAAERDEFLQLAQRTQADFENFRKRAAREAAAASDRGMAKLAKELLPALDHLDLALRAAEEHGGGEFAKGIRQIQDELVGALGRVGIQAYSPKGEPFDPSEHEAMASQPVEGAEAGSHPPILLPSTRRMPLAGQRPTAP